MRHLDRLVRAEGIPLLALNHGIDPERPVLRPAHLVVHGNIRRQHTRIMHADQANLVQLPHRRRHKRLLALRARLRPQRHDQLHRIVAEHAHPGGPDDLSARHVRQVFRQQIQHRLGHPSAMHVHAVQHKKFALQPLILLQHILPPSQS